MKVTVANLNVFPTRRLMNAVKSFFGREFAGPATHPRNNESEVPLSDCEDSGCCPVIVAHLGV